MKALETTGEFSDSKCHFSWFFSVGNIAKITQHSSSGALLHILDCDSPKSINSIELFMVSLLSMMEFTFILDNSLNCDKDLPKKNM